MSLETTLLNLCILSKIEQNGRISRSHNGVVALEPATQYICVMRLLRLDGRRQNLLDIKSIITIATEKVDALLESKYFENKYPDEQSAFQRRLEDLKLLRDGLEGSQGGIQNLMTTYAGDATIVAELDMQLVKITSVLKKIDTRLSPM